MTMGDECPAFIVDNEFGSESNYRPLRELPFESKGSFEKDKKEYQRIRFGLYNQYAKALRESPTRGFKSENAMERIKDIGKLDKCFGIDDILTLAVTNPEEYIRKLRDLDIAGKLF